MDIRKYLEQFSKKRLDNTYTTGISRPKCVDFFCKQYMIWEYSDILTEKIMHEHLVYFKNLYKFYQSSLSYLLEQIVLIPPDQNMFQGVKCPNTPPSFYTTNFNSVSGQSLITV